MKRDESDIDDIRDVSDLLSKKWRVKVLYAVYDDGPYRFSELKRQFDISSKVLTTCLNELTDANLLVRTAHSSSYVTYTHTDAGEGLLSLMDEFNDWDKQSCRPSPPTVLVIESDPRLANLFTDWLDPQYDTDEVSERHELNTDRFRSADVVVYHYQPRGVIDESTIQQFDRHEHEYRLVVIAATRRKVAECNLTQCAHLTLPVHRETLSSCVDTVLDCRPREN